MTERNESNGNYTEDTQSNLSDDSYDVEKLLSHHAKENCRINEKLSDNAYEEGIIIIATFTFQR